MKISFADIVSVEPETIRVSSKKAALSDLTQGEISMLVAGVVVLGAVVYGIVEANNPDRIAPPAIMVEEDKTAEQVQWSLDNLRQPNPVLESLKKQLEVDTAQRELKKSDGKIIDMEVQHNGDGPVLVQSKKSKSRVYKDLSELPSDLVEAAC